MGLFDKVKDAVSSGSNKQETNSEIDNSGSFTVPEWAVKDRVNVEKRKDIIYEHYDVNEAQAQNIAQKLKQEMESTDGYNQDSIRNDLGGEIDIDRDLLETIVWTEMASIETMDRVNSYLEKNDSDDLYKISAPDDDRTHQITREAANEISERNGVTMEELAGILVSKAEKYEDEGGTPERMKHWVPHERFRFSIVRHVDF